MATPNQIKNDQLSIVTLATLNLNIDDYEKLWQQGILPTPEMATKMENSAINHINNNLNDYITIIHRLGNADDPIAQGILKPGLSAARIGIDFGSNTFSLSLEYIIDFNNDNDIMKELKKLCSRATDQKTDVLNHSRSSMLNSDHSINTDDASIQNISQPDAMKNSLLIDDNEVEQLQPELFSSLISMDISSSENDQITLCKKQTLSKKESKLYCIKYIISHYSHKFFLS
jgi:hypothetical protein